MPPNNESSGVKFQHKKGTNLLTIKQTLQVCRIFMLYFILSFHQGIGQWREKNAKEEKERGNKRTQKKMK